MIRALRFLKLMDAEDNTVSLTNLAMWAGVVHFITVPRGDLSATAALIGAMAAYTSKKYLRVRQDDSPDQLADVNSKISELSDKVSRIAMAAGFKPKT